MPKAFFTVDGQPRAVTAIRQAANGQPESLETSLSDGDTAGVHIQGSGSVRFLGIDSPEKEFELPGSGGARRSLDSPEWETYLTDPFNHGFVPADLDPQLADHLRTRIGAGAAANHRLHADAAKQALKTLIQNDMTALGQDTTTFDYFLAFSFEVFDSFGRFLAFINRNQPKDNIPGPRPLAYNERMLENGAALPYFIWPNINPFRARPLLDAVIAPEPQTKSPTAIQSSAAHATS
jgi:hypothetical protein